MGQGNSDASVTLEMMEAVLQDADVPLEYIRTYCYHSSSKAYP